MKKKTLSIIATTLFSMVLVSCGSSTWSWDDAKADGELNYVLLIGQIDHNDSAARTAGICDALGTRAANATANANTEDPVPGTLTLGGVEYDTIELEHAEQKAQGGATWDQATATSTAEAWINKHGSDNDVCVSLTSEQTFLFARCRWHYFNCWDRFINWADDWSNGNYCLNCNV